MPEIERGLLQILFDTAVNSMDFGSGFLDDEEVAALREVAVLLGVDPMVATPEMFQCKYSGEHIGRWDGSGICWRCRQSYGEQRPACPNPPVNSVDGVGPVCADHVEYFAAKGRTINPSMFRHVSWGADAPRCLAISFTEEERMNLVKARL